MVKILYLITQSELGGAQRYVFDLADNLKAEFEVAVAFGEQGDKGELAKKLAKNGIKCYTLPHLQRSLSPLNDFRAVKEIISLIKELKPNIVHLNSSKISILGSLASIFFKLQIKNCKLKIVYTAHGWVFHEPLFWPVKKFYYWAEKLAARAKDLIICVSEFDRQSALNSGLARSYQLATVHNGIAPIAFFEAPEAGNAKHPLPVIGTIGNLYRNKGYRHLIKAIDLLIREEKIEASLFIIGEGPEKLELIKLAEKLNLKNYVNFYGRVDAAYRILPSFDIYACSSVKEGLSYTIIEAMQAKLPIVATRVGGNPELIEDGVTGLLAMPASAPELAAKIKKLLKNKKLADKLGVAARTKALNEFSLQNMVNQTKKEYWKLI